MMNAKGIARLLVVCALIGALLGVAPGIAQAAPAADTPTATVITGRLNVRAGPGVGYTVITQIDQWTKVSLLGRNASATWVNVRLASGIEGWVNVRYIEADVAIATLPVVGVAPFEATATVTVPQLELRTGPGSGYGLIANIPQGHTLTLLGRTADSAWVKVRAGSLGEGWVPAVVVVRVPGHESGENVTPFLANIAIGSLPVVGTTPTPTAPTGARVGLSVSSCVPGTPIYLNVQGFPADRDIAAVLTSPKVPLGMVIARGRTDASGNAQLFFRMPDTWSSGAAIAETHLSLAVGTNDGAVLIWNGLRYSPS